jgi:hypothetical protein
VVVVLGFNCCDIIHDCFFGSRNTFTSAFGKNLSTIQITVNCIGANINVRDDDASIESTSLDFEIELEMSVLEWTRLLKVSSCVGAVPVGLVVSISFFQ